MEVISLGGYSRKHRRGGGSETGKGRKATKGVSSNCYHHGEVKLNPLGELWGVSIDPTSQSHPTQGCGAGVSMC